MAEKPSVTEKEKVYEIWEVLEKFGKYQMLQYLYICVPMLFYTMANINYIFVVMDVPYRCRIPECEDANSTFAVPWWPNGTGRCDRPVLRNTSAHGGTCTLERFTEHVEPCTDWVYVNHDSAVSELGLACRPWAINSVGTVHNLGMLVGMLITGWLSDRYGRKPTMIFGIVVTVVGVAKIFAKSYYIFVAIELLEAVLGGGAYASSMLIMIEITGRTSRILSGVVLAYAIYLGEAIFAILPMFYPNWKILIAIIYLPHLLWIGLVFILHESTRWQVLNGKTKEALASLERVARINKMKVNMQDLSSIDDKKLKQMFNIENYEKREGLREVLMSKEMLKRLLVGAVSRFTSNFVYYGLMINSVWLPGDKYTNFLLASVMSFPGELIALYLMNKVGRKLPLIVGFVICGAMCVITAFVPDDMRWAKITVFLIGKVIVSVCFTGCITYSMELFPTSARGSLLGVCAFAARAGGMLAPLTPVLNQVSEMLPPICFGACAVITGLLTTLTPETKHMPLMDTIEQAEANVSPKRRMEVHVDNLGFKGDSDP